MPELRTLSQREKDVLRLVVLGLTNREIAQKLTISPNTVKVHLSNIFEKIGVASRTEATVYAIEHRIVEVPGGVSASRREENPFYEFVRQLLWVWVAFGLLALVFIFTLIFRTSSNNDNYSQYEVERWQELAPMPEPRFGSAAVAYGGSIYVIAGEGPEGISNEVFNYSISDNYWVTVSEKPTPVAEVDGVLIGEKIYIPGGREGNGQLTHILEIYDPRLDTWEVGAEMPDSLCSYALVNYEGLLYLFGGWNGVEQSNKVYIYDPSIDNWLEGSQMPVEMTDVMAVVSGGEILVLGGGEIENNMDYAYVYLPNRDAADEKPWVELTGLQESLWSPIFGLEEMGGLIILVAPIEEGTYSFLFYYPQEDTWIYSSEISSELFPASSSSVSIQGYLYLLGGKDNNGAISPAIMRYQGLFITAFPNISR